MIKRTTLVNCLHMAYAAHHPTSVVLHKLEHASNPELIRLADEAEKATKALCEALSQLTDTP